jgi:hypothetical protein
VPRPPSRAPSEERVAPLEGRVARSEERATPKPAGGWREQLGQCLEAFTDELPPDLAALPATLYDEWVELALALAHAAVLGEDLGVDEDAGAQPPVAERWRVLLELGRRHHLDARPDDTGRFVALSDVAVSAEMLRRLACWLSALAERAREGEDGPVRELGALHESLLGLSFQRLARPHRRLRKSRVWLSPADVLEWPAKLRAKRLQRELGLSKNSVHAFGASLARASNEAEVEGCLLPLFDPRVEVRAAGRWVLRTGGARRSSGAHYTPWPLCLALVERTLAPLLERLPAPRSEALLALRVCDPAMGAGAFLIATVRFLGAALAAAWAAEGGPERSVLAARRAVTIGVLRGVDKNATAVSVARLCLSLYAGSETPLPELQENLRRGDALLGEPGPGGATPGTPLPETERSLAIDWGATFGDVFGRVDGGFDAILGNPPWVAYVGRAAQPLEPALFAYYAATNPAFKRYRTLHGLFVYRAATLLRGGGRLGLVLPTSVADLDGYAATRAAHDALCSVDAELPDWADGAFDGVFQPCMALLSTRLTAARAATCSGIWPLRNDLGAAERRLLERLARLERLPRELFGERGFQTTEDDQAHLLRTHAAPPRGSIPLREGADVGEFRVLAPQLFAIAQIGPRLRPAADWQEVKLLIRQTARFPMASLSDGVAFRNSILAGYERPGYPATLLLALLNSSLLRWLHYTQQRDARQGMPQLKVGHLRALPAPPRDRPALLVSLGAFAQRLGAENRGLCQEDRESLDTLVSELFGLVANEREIVSAWARATPPPVSRRQEPKPRVPRPADLSARDV